MSNFIKSVNLLNFSLKTPDCRQNVYFFLLTAQFTFFGVILSLSVTHKQIELLTCGLPRTANSTKSGGFYFDV